MPPTVGFVSKDLILDEAAKHAADGARSAVAKQCLPGAERIPCVFAYHEIIKSPPKNTDQFDASRCDVYYQGRLSPDFYAWLGSDEARSLAME